MPKKNKSARVENNNMLFQVGDLVKRTHPPYDYWLGIVVDIEVKKYKLYQRRPPQDMTTIWVKWMNIGTPEARLSMAWEPESYWAEDLQVVSKAK